MFNFTSYQCDIGKYVNTQQKCTECPTGWYQDTQGKDKCNECTGGWIPNPKRRDCIKPPWPFAEECQKHEYLNDTASDKMEWKCTVCPKNSYCVQGHPPRTMNGFWKAPWYDEIIDLTESNKAPEPRFLCMEKEACLGAYKTSNSSIILMEERCAQNYTGPLCAACSRGSYKQAASFRCIGCFQDASLSFLFIFFVVAATLSVIIGFTLATVADGGEASAVDVIILKIAVNSGIISAGASAFPLAWPPVVVTMFQMYAVASASAIGDSLSADCVLRESDMKPVQAWALTLAIISPCVVFLWIVLFGVMRFVSGKIKYLRVHLPVAVIVTLTLAHPVITKSAVKLMACRTIAGRPFLDADFNISCDGPMYTVWVKAVAIPMIILFTFGVPFAYALAMYRHVLNKTLHDHRDIYGFFFSGFRKEIWWFELWNTLRKSLFTIAAVLFAPAGVRMQTWGALSLLLFFLAVFSVTKPYEQDYLNRLERNALSINIVTLLFGLGLFTNSQSGEQESKIFAMCITISIVFLNVAFVLNVFQTLYKYSQYCNKKNSNEKSIKIVPRRSGSSSRSLTLAFVNKAVTEHKLVKFEKAHDEQHAKSIELILERKKVASSRVRQRLINRRNNKIIRGKKKSTKEELNEIERVRQILKEKIGTYVRLKKMFLKLDVEHSGLLSKKEFAQMITTLLKVDTEETKINILWEECWHQRKHGGADEMDATTLAHWLDIRCNQSVI